MSETVYVSSEEVGRRGEAIYVNKLRSALESANFGKFLSIDIDTEDFEIGDDRLENIHRLRERHDDATVYTLRIGYPAVVAIGAQLRPTSS